LRGHLGRTTGAWASFATLTDEEGNELWQFPATWSDEQILAALEFANSAYRRGIEYGQRIKAEQVRRALYDEPVTR
jgi:hypothetical protein